MSSAPVYEHRLKRRVQFHETDAAGVVHFSRYFQYMEEAEHALWRSAGLSVHPRGAELGWPRTFASFEYHRPLFFEEEFEAWIRIVAIDERTISFVCLLSRDGARVATGRVTVSCAVLKAGEPMRGAKVPEDIRARLAVAPDETLPPLAEGPRGRPA